MHLEQSYDPHGSLWKVVDEGNHRASVADRDRPSEECSVNGSTNGRSESVKGSVHQGSSFHPKTGNSGDPKATLIDFCAIVISQPLQTASAEAKAGRQPQPR